MRELLQLEKLRERIIGYVNLRSENMIAHEEPLRIEARYVLAEIMIRGELARISHQEIFFSARRSENGSGNVPEYVEHVILALTQLRNKVHRKNTL